MAELRFTILGCGSSGGVPRLGGHWGACDPNNSRNNRTRCSLLIQRIDTGGVTSVLIDTSPDMRAQLLDANVGELDAVVYTHEHADHLHGMDDLRMIVLAMKKRLPVYAGPRTKDMIMSRFGYVFETPEGSPYPPILDMHDLGDELIIDGAGGPIKITTFDVEHGNIDVRAIRVNDVLYTPDISALMGDPENDLADIKCWILDSLRYTPHPSHANVEQALEWIKSYAPERAVLTNMHIDLDYETLDGETPDNVTPAFDGMQITYKV
jgi:phosphoribosyl 1,2-cyclic phosphate phosphodiesterase